MGFLSSLFGVGGSKPRTETNIVQQQLPKEISPFVTEIAEEAQELFKERVAEGYTPYTGQAIAPLTAQQEAAMTGIEGLVGTTRPLQEEALGITRQQAERFTPESAEAYMSPYQRAVTDIEKREAGRQFDVAQQARDAQAAGAGAGSLMGTRSAILEAEAQRNQQQLLADIESRGLQSAYQDAQRAFEAQKARERAMAGDIAATGPAMLASGLQEQGALQTVGEERRDLGQATLDEAYFKFLEERQFPEQTLSDYSAFIYGNPMSKLANTTTTGTMTPYQPSLGQTLLGIGSTLGAAALRNPNVTKMFKGGGYLDRNRGLSGLPMFRRQEAGQVVNNNLESDEFPTGSYAPDDRPELVQAGQKLIDFISPSFEEGNNLSQELYRLDPSYMYKDDDVRAGLVRQAKINLGMDTEEDIRAKEALGEKAAAEYKERVDASRQEKAKALLARLGGQQEVSDLKREEVENLVTLAPKSEAVATRKKTEQAIEKVRDLQEKEKATTDLSDINIEDDFDAELADLTGATITNIKAKTPKEKANKKKVIKSLANQPSEGSLQPKTEAEAAAEYDKNPAAFGDMTKEQYLKDTADYNKRYMDIINKLYPESQNEFLADALQALGAMFVAENKGEAFTKTFNKLQEAGLKRRDARRVALGKAALENLKTDKETMEKIRQLPKQRRDAIMALVEQREKQIDRAGTRRYRDAMTKKALADAVRLGIPTTKTPKIFSAKDTLANVKIIGDSDATPLATVNRLIDRNPSAFAASIGLSPDTPVDSIKSYVENIYKDERFGEQVSSLSGVIVMNPGKGKIIDPVSALSKAALSLLPNYEFKEGNYVPEFLGGSSDRVVLRPYR